MSDVKVVIPARFGSSRLPGKPLLEINDKPLFWHVVRRVREAGINQADIILATDSQLILNKAQELGIQAVMTCSSHVSGTDRVNEVANIKQWGAETIIVNVQGDEPLVPSSLIQGLIGFTQRHVDFEITTPIAPISDPKEWQSANIVKVVTSNSGKAIYFSRAAIPHDRDKDGMSTSAYRHIGMYAYRRASLSRLCILPESKLEKLEKLEQLRALENDIPIGTLKIIEAPSHGVDTEQDFIKIKKFMEESNEKYRYS